jgi:hypothetical protein
MEDTCGECKFSEVILEQYSETWVCTHPASFGKVLSEGPNDPPLRCGNYERHDHVH